MTGPAGRLPSRVVLAVAGYAAARAALRVAGRLDDRSQTNYRGRDVSLAAGPALAVAASATAAAGAAAAGRRDLAAATLLAGLAAGAVGRYDDVAGDPAVKGLRGHLDAVRAGRITSGVLKVIGLGCAGLLAAAALPRRQRRRAWRAADVVLGAGLIAGSANVLNLLDLRPGRAVKSGLLVAVPLVASTLTAPRSALAGPVGASVALLGDDLAERVMLGDAGANALGAVLGVALADRAGLVGRGLMLAAIAALTIASERVSFTKVIESTPFLRQLDQFGRP